MVDGGWRIAIPLSSTFYTLSSASYSSSFRRPAAVMRYRRNVFDQADIDAGGLKSSQRRFASRSWATNKYLHGSQSMIHRFFGGAVRCLLRREWRSFARPLESHRSRARPGNNITLVIGNRHDRVVESRVNMDHAFGNVFPAALLACDCFARSLAGARVGMGALAANRQILAVT